MPVKSKNPNMKSAIKKHLATWEKPALQALIQDLYDSHAVNRDFIHARCQTADGVNEVVENYRKKIIDQFYPARGEAKLKLGEARKAIRDYRKATGDINGTAELLLTYVEKGTEFTCEYGDIDERFYNSMESALSELATLLRGKAREMYEAQSQRLANLELMTNGIGWGYGDFVAEIVDDLVEELG